MSFTFPVFLGFLALFGALWPWLRIHETRRWAGITAFSLVFYGWWDWRFTFLLAGTGLLDFWLARWMTVRPAWRRPLLWISVISNLGVLGFFKYTAFFARELTFTFGWPGDAAMRAAESIILPVGISFYTFQSLSYTIDVYRGQLQPVRSQLHFLAYLSLFPQLVAGPIIRAADLLPQLLHAGDYSAANRWRGLERIALGYVKKVVVADNIAPLVNLLFTPTAAPALGGAECWLGAVLFGIQIYCDFSGYSDIAIGLARWMGYSFPENFDRPYGALGLRDFWSRWHLSLSTWFRDYVYIPLGGSRTSPARAHGNLWATMLLSGLWHGANFTFIAWGAAHAALLSIERLTAWPERCRAARIPRLVGCGFTFAAVTLAWVIFRAHSLNHAGLFLARMLLDPLAGLERLPIHLVSGVQVALLAYCVVALGHRIVLRQRDQGRPIPKALRFAATIALLVAAVFLRGPGNDFIYFQF